MALSRTELSEGPTQGNQLGMTGERHRMGLFAVLLRGDRAM